jgi:hypothetical protein
MKTLVYNLTESYYELIKKIEIESLLIGIPCQRPQRGLLIREIELDFRLRHLKRSWCHRNARKGEDEGNCRKEIERWMRNL